MTQGDVVTLISNSCYLVLMVSLPIVCMALVVGFMISLFQAVTQIQEQTLTFVPKMVVVLLMLAFLSPYMTAKWMEYTTGLWSKIPEYAAH